jgi:hypothetical protein
MKQLLRPLMYLAGAASVASLFVHLAALAGRNLVGERGMLFLHAGIFVVWIPTVVLTIGRARALSPSRKLARQLDRRAREATAFPGVPSWMQRCHDGVSLYGVISGLWLSALSDGSHAKLTLVAAVRVFSIGWLIFYGAAFMRLYSSVWTLRRKHD